MAQLMRIKRNDTYPPFKFRITCRLCAGWGNSASTLDLAFNRVAEHLWQHREEARINNRLKSLAKDRTSLLK